MSSRVVHVISVARQVGIALAALSIAVAALRIFGVAMGGEMVSQRETHTLKLTIKYSVIALFLLLLLGPIIKIGSSIGSKYEWNPDPASWGYSTTINTGNITGDLPVEAGSTDDGG